MKRICSIEGCDKLVSARGWCAMHWARWRATGSTYRPPRSTNEHCQVDGCEKSGYSRNYCKTHYEQVRRGIEPFLYKSCLFCGKAITDRVMHAELHYECIKPHQQDVRYKREYGLSFNEYNQLREYQLDRCAVCFEASDEPLHVDHDHETGQVRGLLCGDCNRALGLLRDRTTSLRAAIEYLQMPPELRRKVNLLVPGVAL